MREVFGKIIYDSIAEIVHPKHTCLLLVDVTNDFYSPQGYFAAQKRELSMLQAMLPKLKQLLAEARRSGVMCIHLQNTVLPDGRSDSPSFYRYKDSTVEGIPVYTIEETWGWEFVDGFQPDNGEVVVKKHRPSGFVHTDLEQILRASGIKSVVVTGCTSEGCVQSTAIDAMYRDYYTVVVPECIASYTDDLHNAALKWMKPKVELVGMSDIIDVWKKLRQP